MLVSGDDFYCGNSSGSPCQFALKNQIPSQYVHPFTKQCNYSVDLSSYAKKSDLDSIKNSPSFQIEPQCIYSNKFLELNNVDVNIDNCENYIWHVKPYPRTFLGEGYQNIIYKLDVYSNGYASNTSGLYLWWYFKNYVNIDDYVPSLSRPSNANIRIFDKSIDTNNTTCTRAYSYVSNVIVRNPFTNTYSGESKYSGTDGSMTVGNVKECDISFFMNGRAQGTFHISTAYMIASVWAY